ncbi:zinc finger protein 438 isoform X1 [Polypterus senegalus]|uniref:zinc finger protein 438 isoform X1 n=1 Tax=Polypterus senegalus TaxID=55291 RepID=UPI001962BF71|nr:zinc finger protein 438 isoform X1 [Polypterus senegalus]XP_039609782.1 zinc finger protein 438 isoform X1 [Polypterus senegalus]XP_039609784.1 zinc finger protein 438 isoform X1 [Polypterus senegalus]XP_039609785.1 zinc finger protein 438 isoform X1 [Polypterus senegalus]XP_039609786.1 zinc finger protein 438 isoform X1 [Polypterus senegalus]
MDNRLMKSQIQKKNLNILDSSAPIKGELKTISSTNQPKCSQFRTIAPKVSPTLVSPAILSCQSSCVPDTPVTNSKSIIVPTQNYALMQVAGHEGTFSLVALSPSLSSQSPQQIQKDTAFSKNIKLPIPRCQPLRSKQTPEKKRRSQKSLKFASNESKDQNKMKIQVKPPSSATMHSVAPSTSDGSEQVILIDPRSSEITVTTLLPEDAALDNKPIEKPTETDQSFQDPSNASVLQHVQVIANTSGYSTLLTKQDKTIKSPKKEESLSKSMDPSSNITVLSPTIFSNTIQIIPEKLPILPYSKVKDTVYSMAKSNAELPEISAINTQPAVGKRKRINLRHLPVPSQMCQRERSDSQSCLHQTATKHSTSDMEKEVKEKPQKMIIGPGKKRGRKRRTIEDVLALEAKRKRSFSFIKKSGTDSPVANSFKSQEKIIDISKKYRNIMPKPVVVVEPVPQATSINPLSSNECLDRKVFMSHKADGDDANHPDAIQTLGNAYVLLGSKQFYKCPTCDRCFQFKHHLQSHMNSHTNSRPYMCPLCRKTYAHSGSLSTHMKLHHSEGRHKKSMPCEFCDKVFGYVGVYFSHLKEVHKVILSAEPSVKHHHQVQSGKTKEREPVTSAKETVELQIKCGRCLAITPTFADMKLHLLYVHGEEIQVRLKEGIIQGGRDAEDELVKHAARYWKQLNEKRNLVKCGSCKEEFYSFSKLKKHIYCHHHDESEIIIECASHETESEPTVKESTSRILDSNSDLGSELGFHCILCKEVADSSDELFVHWQSYHKCENPELLWTIINSYIQRENGGKRELL